MGDLVLFLFYSALILIVALLLLSPLLAEAFSSKALLTRRLISGIAGYFGLVVILASYGYLMIPAQYTAGLDFSRLPQSSSLASIHAEYRDGLQRPSGYGPEKAEEIRQTMRQQQITYAQRWLLLSIAGAALIALVWPVRAIGASFASRS